MSRLSRPFLAAAVASAALAALPAAASAVPDFPGGTGPLNATPTPPTTLPTVWGCHPGTTPNPCEGSLQTTVLSSPQLALRKVARVEDRAPATTPPVDCFYVYPTVTSATGSNAPRRIDGDVQGVLRAQAAAFSSVCRVFAPVYRQASLTDTASAFLTNQTKASAAQDLAFSDVLGAWRDYLANDNDGRGVVLVGHSQGSGMLMRLIATDFERNAALRAKLVGAILPGANFEVRKGERVGGNSETVPTCATAGEAGCVTAFSTYADRPGRSSYFGQIGPLSKAFGGPVGDDLEIACTNPAALAGDGETLRPWLRTTVPPGTNGLIERAFWNGLRPNSSSTWTVPGDQFTSYCDRQNGTNTLRLRVGAGTLRPAALPTGEWGLHVGEMGLSLASLTRIAALQTASYLADVRS